MNFLLFLAATAGAAYLYGQLQKRNKELHASKTALGELEHRFDAYQQQSKKRIQELETKYGGIISREEAEQKLDEKIRSLKQESKQLRSETSELKQKLQPLQEQDFLESFGFYESKYDFESAERYKSKLDEIRNRQKAMIKDKTAAVCHSEWTISGSKREGQKWTNNFLKLILRAFNGECDSAVVKVKYNNINTMENRVKKAHGEINKLAESGNCEITVQYLNLKLEELYLTHEYQDKKQAELEEQRRIREQMREEERALREIEKLKEEAEREERKYQEALAKARAEAESATGRAQQKLMSQVEELQRRLQEAEANKERAISRAQMTKSGHVYIISNIGSFGDEVYKIGMTRRLEPMDRVQELGDASVPFPFDVHAMIYCENAPELENRLHKCFHHHRLNKINERKEFFRVSLEDIEKAVHQIDLELGTCKSEVSFTKAAEAAEYRKTKAKERTVAA